MSIEITLLHDKQYSKTQSISKIRKQKQQSQKQLKTNNQQSSKNKNENDKRTNA